MLIVWYNICMPMSRETKNKISKRLKGNKNALGVKRTQEFKDKISKRTLGKKYPYKPRPVFQGVFKEDKNPFWKGDNAKKSAMHVWVNTWKGKPRKCENCGTETAKKFEWANVDHKYRRVLEDYIRMCTSCHRKYDRDRGVKINQW